MNNRPTFKRLGIKTLNEHFVYMSTESDVCKSEGFETLTRVRVSRGDRSIVACLNSIASDILNKGEISLSEEAAEFLNVEDSDQLEVSHLEMIDSLSHLRSKIHGNRFTQNGLNEIMKDIVGGLYSNIHMSAFITACADGQLVLGELIALTKAMIACGHRLEWQADQIIDKHCIGGLPGNRTTPIIVAIATSCGAIMPKTSSRAVTSPAGTADTMEVMTKVNLTLNEIQAVIMKEGGCLAWGSIAELSPADEKLIRVERALGIDSQSQLIASVLSKKVAAGADKVLIDIPVGNTAKVRSMADALELKSKMEEVAKAVNLELKTIITDGESPIGRGIGPSLEAHDVLSVLRNEVNAPTDLKNKALFLTGELLEFAELAAKGKGHQKAKEVLESGNAYKKFLAICIAQGEFKEPGRAPYIHEVHSPTTGTVVNFDNRRLAKVAKLAGAPSDKLAGIYLHCQLDKHVDKGETIFEIHAESPGALEYALKYYQVESDMITIEQVNGLLGL